LIDLYKVWHPALLKPQFHLWQHTIQEVAEMMIREQFDNDGVGGEFATIKHLGSYHADDTELGIKYFKYWRNNLIDTEGRD
jgi:hypothetical protein